MTSLLIIDDEPRQVRSLANVIRRLRPQFTVHEAFDGLSGWRVLETQRVDAVITDIRMPGMDGIALVSQIAERMPHVKTVLLTGYGEFQYAREALRRGVLDYLVKPVGLQEIRNMLDLIERTLAKEADAHYKSSVYRDYWFQQLLSGQLTPQMENDLAWLLPAGDAIRVLVVRSLQEDECPDPVREAFKRQLDERLGGLGAGVPFLIRTPSREWAGLIVMRSEPSGGRSARMLQGVRLSLAWCEDHCHARLAAGISTRQALSVPHIQRAYEEARTALRHRFYQAFEPLIAFDAVSPFAQVAAPVWHGKEEAVLRAIRASDWKTVSDTVHELFRQFSHPPFPDPDRLKTEMVHFVMRVGMQLKGFLADGSISRDEQEISRKIASCGDVQALRYAVKEILMRWLDEAADWNRSKNTALVKHCLDYLESHYMEDISLESMARKLRLSPSYCSNMFKQVTGTCFSEYLMRLRIAKAREMLLATDEKIGEIARKTGFRDAAYFNKVFKRETGVTPNTFRQSAGSVKTG
jgi:two-component system response regulator YesN